MSSAKGVGIPVKLLHEAEGHTLTVSQDCGNRDQISYTLLV